LRRLPVRMGHEWGSEWMGTVQILESSSVAVRRDQVEIDGEKARVRLVKTKGNTDRYVRIPLTLLENIEE
jgi:hypothetical protein